MCQVSHVVCCRQILDYAEYWWACIGGGMLNVWNFVFFLENVLSVLLLCVQSLVLAGLSLIGDVLAIILV
jgi:hypothetical protein